MSSIEGKKIVYDACVLYPASLRSFLIWLGVNGLVRPRWSERILDECFNSILRNRPDLAEADLSRTRELMCEAIPDCLISDFENLIPKLTLPDPGDRHVLAAAIKGRAEAIVTFNLDDFPVERLQPHRVSVLSPDSLVLEFIDSRPDEVLGCVDDEVSIRANPPRDRQDVLSSVERCGLTESSRRLRELSRSA
jgi:predicted nucleic acid-binding protein